MTDSSAQRGPRRNLGYGALLALLGAFTVWNAPSVAAQFSGVALVFLVLGDLIVCAASIRRVQPVIDCAGVFATDEAIPVRILGVSASEMTRNQLSIRVSARDVMFAAPTRSVIALTIGLDRGHHRSLGLRLFRPSPLGLFCLARRYQCPVDVLVGPRRGQIEVKQTSGAEQTIGGVRVAQSADPRRLVHWGSSAKTQQLMVKELTPASGQNASILSIVADPAWKKGSERDGVAERARAYAEDALGNGRGVQLITAGRANSIRQTPEAPAPRITAVGGALVSATPPSTQSTNGADPVRITRVNSQREILSVLATAGSGIGDISRLQGEVVHVQEEGDTWSAS